MRGGRVLEIGCGRGVGVELIFDLFGVSTVDALDLNPRMIRRARSRLRTRGPNARFWVGDATRIAARNSTYDAVFDFGIIHHIPEWPRALRQVERVLKPGGRFYAEEVLSRLVDHPLTRTFLDHPLTDRFDSSAFIAGLREAGLTALAIKKFSPVIAWFIAVKTVVS